MSLALLCILFNCHILHLRNDLEVGGHWNLFLTLWQYVAVYVVLNENDLVTDDVPSFKQQTYYTCAQKYFNATFYHHVLNATPLNKGVKYTQALVVLNWKKKSSGFFYPLEFLFN